MPFNQLTESQKNQIVEQYCAGNSSIEIGKRFGCSDRTVMRLIQARLSAADVAVIKARVRKKPAQEKPVTPAPTSFRLTRKRSSAASKPTGGGLTRSAVGTFANRLTESQKAQIVEEYRAGSNSIEIGKRFGCSDRTVMRLVRVRLSAAEVAVIKARVRKKRAQMASAASPRMEEHSQTAHKSTGGFLRSSVGTFANRFTKSQEDQIVEEYRAGNSSIVLGKRFGCSGRTVMRLVQDRLSAAEVEALKAKIRRKPSQARSAPSAPFPQATKHPQTAHKSPSTSTGSAIPLFTNRFTESQKDQIVEEYRAGSSSIVLGKRFGCSDRTIMRVVQARLSAAEVEALKVKIRRGLLQTKSGPLSNLSSPLAKRRQPSSRTFKRIGSAPSQLTEHQKVQIVEQYRAGDSSSIVAKRVGCSDKTVMRLLHARLSTTELEALKAQNRRKLAKRQSSAASKTTVTTSSAVGSPKGASANRLTESQKVQIVEHYCAGNSSIVVAKHFGCSDRTVMRLVQARLGPAELAVIKAKVRRNLAQAHHAPAAPLAAQNGHSRSIDEAGDEPIDNATGTNVFPWDDADDFAENEGRDNVAIEDDNTILPATSNQGANKNARKSVEVIRAKKLDVNQLSSPLYLVVERSVELQPQTLCSLQHLGPLDTDEQQRQGLVLFSNVRQAKRQCRRNQRIVKVADPKLLSKTAPHLLAKGISRLVVESSLYALPGSAAAVQS